MDVSEICGTSTLWNREEWIIFRQAKVTVWIGLGLGYSWG